MSILKQRTIKNPIDFEGIGLHSGKKVKMVLRPSEPNSGIKFYRTDLKRNNLVLPNIYNVSNATLCTTITNEYGISISTIEHLMGALYGLGIDNVNIELDAQEVPILDGSAKNFVEKIITTGFKISNEPIKIIKINNSVSINEGAKNITFEKSKLNLEIDFEIKYSNKVINTQRNAINVYQDNLKDIFEARTFCLYEDIEKMHKLGLAKGGSLENAIVVKGEKILNKENLRNPKEFVNHKILDCIGDLYLSGYRIIGALKCSGGGHSLTNKLLRKLFDNKENFSIYEINEKNLPHWYVQKSHLKSIA
tara:strand:- start:501 stop:1421 length:921 start_codon:yes stop_codon:yes gene_type:complete